MKSRLLFSISAIAVLGAFLALGSCKKDSSSSSSLSISVTSKTVAVEGETFTVDVTSGGTWSYTSTYSGTGGSGWVRATTVGANKGNGQVQVVVSPNTTSSERAMDLVFSDGSGKQTLHIDQAGAPLSFSTSFATDTTAFGRKTSLSGTVLSNASWTAAANDNSWISVNPASGTPNTAGVPVTIMLTANTGGQSRTGSVTFSAGGQNTKINITQGAAEANSYIIAPGGSWSIPLSQANADGTTRIAVTDEVTPQFIWGDMGGVGASGVVNTMTVEGTGAARSIKVTAGSTQGNAVIAAYVNGVLKWSWHIWVTSLDPVATGQSYAGTDWTGAGRYVGKKIMDRNLGALSATPSTALPSLTLGLMYQWGRKDPFPAQFQSWTSSTEPNLYDGSGGNRNTIIQIYQPPTTQVNNLEYSIAHPTYFYAPQAAPYDWYVGTAGTQNNNLWGNGGDKTAYDPCPPGWMVPANTAFNDFHTGTNSSTWAYRNTAVLGYKSAWVDLPTAQAGANPLMSGTGCYYSPTASATAPTSYPVYIPAAGIRYYSLGVLAFLAGSTGTVNGVPNLPIAQANLWSSIGGTNSLATNAYSFGANMSYPYFLMSIQRAMGMPVRCIQQ